MFVWFNEDGFIRQIERHILDAFEELQIEHKVCYIADFPREVKEYNPILVVFFHPNKKIYEFVKDIDEAKCHKLLWDMESPYESDIVFDMLPHIYYIFTSDQNTAEALKKESTANQIFYVPHACNPKEHYKISYKDIPFEYKSDITLVGNAYNSRLKYLQDNQETFQNNMVTLVGIGYWGLSGFKNQRFIKRHANLDECRLYYNGAKTVLNIHRTNEDLDMANSRGIKPKHLNNRFYELSAMGVRQIVENRDDMLEEIEKIQKMKPDEYSYVARLKEFFVPLIKK